MAVTVEHVIKSANGQWWVVNTTPPPYTTTEYTVMEGTQAQALALPNGGGISGPYTSLAAANKVADAEPANSTQGIAPGLGITPSGGYTATNPLSGLQSIGNFFSTLTQPDTWIRVAKVIIGGTLLIIGIAHITGASDAVSTAARKAPLPV
jgi:hypothetical protein